MSCLVARVESLSSRQCVDSMACLSVNRQLESAQADVDRRDRVCSTTWGCRDERLLRSECSLVMGCMAISGSMLALSEFLKCVWWLIVSEVNVGKERP